MPDVRLRVNGIEYGGWKRARVTRSLECIAGSFELSVTDRWAGQDRAWPIAEEDECELVVDGETLITGYVDRRELSYSASDHALSISGRDRAGDLVDCSADLKKWEFLGVPLLTVARRICEPLGIAVSLQPGMAPPPAPPKVTVDPGQSAFEALEEACRLAGVLPISDGRGGVVLTRAGTARAATALVQGENILAADASFDGAGRFRRYRVLGQHQGSDEWSGSAAAAVLGEAQDLGVRRASRVLLVRPEGGVTPALAKRRAEWEAKVRAGRGAGATITVQGWRQGSGALWPLNARAPVRSPYLGIDGEMLISSVTLSLDNRGSIAELGLVRPDAYLPEPAIAKDAEKRWRELA